MKRVTVSLPDDVAAYLDNATNVSAAVADAIRAHMDRAETIRAMLHASGINPRPGHGKLPPLSDQAKANIARTRDELRAGTWQPRNTTAA